MGPEWAERLLVVQEALGPEWAERLLVVQEALVEASQGGNLQQAAVAVAAAAAPEDQVVAAALDQVQEAVELVVLAALVVVAQAEVSSMAETMMTPKMSPTNEGRQANLPRDQSLHWPGKNLKGQLRMVASTSVQE